MASLRILIFGHVLCLRYTRMDSGTQATPRYPGCTFSSATGVHHQKTVGTSLQISGAKSGHTPADSHLVKPRAPPPHLRDPPQGSVSAPRITWIHESITDPRSPSTARHTRQSRSSTASPRSSSRSSPEPTPPGDVAQVGGSAGLGAPRELLRGSKTLTLTPCSMDKELPVHTCRAPGSPGQLPPCTHRCPLPETSATRHPLLHSAVKEASSALP